MFSLFATMNKKRKPSKAKVDDTVTHCPITQAPLVDPVVASDGHTYERMAIMEWLEKAQTSPMTREEISTVVYPNLKVRQMVQLLSPEVADGAQIVLRKIHDLELEHLASEVRTDKDPSYLAGLVPTVLRLQAGNCEPKVTVVTSANVAYHYLVSTQNVRTDLPIAVPSMPYYSSDIMRWCEEICDLVSFLMTTHTVKVLDVFRQIERLITHFGNSIKERENLRMHCVELGNNLDKHVPQSAKLLCDDPAVLCNTSDFVTVIDLFFEPSYDYALVHGKLDDACSKYFPAVK